MIDRRALADGAAAALARLPDLYRSAFVLHDLEELTTSEVADVLGVAPATVRQHRRDRDGQQQPGFRRVVVRTQLPVRRSHTQLRGWLGRNFNVSLSGELRSPVLTVAFYSGDVLCGYAADVRDRITAGQTVTFRPTWISLSDEFGTFSQACALPATTTRMVAVLWSDDDWTTQISQEFTTMYKFVRP